LEIIAGNSFDYSLPGYEDEDGDGVSLKVKGVPGFASHNKGKFTFIPTDSDVGTYQLSITLEDDHPYFPLTTTYSLSVNIISSESIIDEED